MKNIPNDGYRIMWFIPVEMLISGAVLYAMLHYGAAAVISTLCITAILGKVLHKRLHTIRLAKPNVALRQPKNRYKLLSTR